MAALGVCPGAWLLHVAEARAHFPWVQQHCIAHAGEGRPGAPVLGPVGGGRQCRIVEGLAGVLDINRPTKLNDNSANQN
jgi:hypothetical protein